MNPQTSTPPTHPHSHAQYYHNWANRTTRFFYAGPINLHHDHADALAFPESDAQYSWGIRQTVYRMYKNEPGFKVGCGGGEKGVGDMEQGPSS